MEQNEITAEFEYTFFQWIMAGIFLLCAAIVYFTEEPGLLFAAAMLVGAASLVCGLVTAISSRGSITVNDGGIKISYNFFNFTVKEINIRYTETACALTEIETHGDRYGHVRYTTMLYLTLKDGRQIKLKAQLNVSDDLPVKAPSEFKEKAEKAPLAAAARLIEQNRMKGFA